MTKQPLSRRRFLGDLSLAATTLAMASAPAYSTPDAQERALHVATNAYPWMTSYRRDGRDFNATLDAALGEMAASGLEGLEPLVSAPAELDRLAPLLEKHRLAMRSLYVNSVLHVKEQATQSMDAVLAIAERAKRIGTRIIVTNPSPIRWGGPENKDDAQLEVQAASLDTLGARLGKMGLTLAYHNHDIELRNAAREFHHMMVGTNPRHVTLCLDAHWIYRGAGNSSIALFDILKLYGPRITELHLRQSRAGTWTESFGDGDIDYRALAAYVRKIKRRPHIVLEQAVEQGTPKTMSCADAHRESGRTVREIFAAFAT